MTKTQKIWVMNRYATGPMGDDNLVLREEPVAEPKEGEIRVRNVYLSVDPTNGPWLSPNPTYLPPMAIGDPARGFVIGVIEKSRAKGWAEGDVVFGLMYWAEYCVVDPEKVIFMMKMPPADDVSLEASMCALSMLGHTAYYGMLVKGRPLPSETVLVSGAAGATGSLAGQMAKLAGARVVGIAGGEAKCRTLIEEFGFDAAIDYKKGELTQAIAAACPNGVDVFFDNIGGPTLDAALANLADVARVVMCGSISSYSNLHDARAAVSGTTAAAGQQAPAIPSLKNTLGIFFRKATMEGILVFDFFGSRQQKKCARHLVQWYREGKLRYRSHILDGIESAFPAIRMLYSGDNQGKLLVRVADFAR
ncbi:MAG TPA: NADP-dependent oxidoreductase [Rubrivivax sp.]|nr:NADP-dependent oxidoreductase [Rubrivivax sp.]